MDWTLELVVVPVSDVDRAKKFYIEQAGFSLDVDTGAARTSGSSSCRLPARPARSPSGPGSTMPPGSLHGLHLVVSDIEAARDELIRRAPRSVTPSTSARPARRRAWIPSGAATRRSCRSRTPMATPGWSRRSSGTGSVEVKLVEVAA